MTDDFNTLELSPALGRFVELVARGYDPADAAELAGYDRSEARALFRHPAVSEAIAQEARKLASGRLVPLALRALTRLMEDPTTPPVTIARVALGILSQAGTATPAGKRAASPEHPNDDPLTSLPLSDMTKEQLAAAKKNINQLLTLESKVDTTKTLTPQRAAG